MLNIKYNVLLRRRGQKQRLAFVEQNCCLAAWRYNFVNRKYNSDKPHLLLLVVLLIIATNKKYNNKYKFLKVAPP